MSRIESLTAQFVEYMPSRLAPGILYVSMEHRTTRHLCACGCGESVVLPLHPGQWAITFDGDHLTLWPSVGNIGQACRSHYLIRSNQIVWSYDLSAEEERKARLSNSGALGVMSDPEQSAVPDSEFGRPGLRTRLSLLLRRSRT